ncbi:MAG TPA: helix-turn-helix transcriptional regulator [Balneolales bacterium]|nr:helix-turn-helix transcriptional regulator [Balneolales bacterium]
MDKSENIEELYKRKFGSAPERLKMEIGHFNVFKLDPFVGDHAKPVPYKKRDYYKVMLVLGGGEVHYADKLLEVKKQALTFFNPLIPYKWEHLEQVDGGLFCIFDDAFFHNFGDLHQYSVFQPDGHHIFELSDEQVKKVQDIFNQMFVEISSDYIHKYDVLRNLMFELIHFALKMNPSSSLENQEINASQRISLLFEELLERQFPIDDSHKSLSLRSASDFANQLNVHVNHLNRALRETTGKTTSQHINDRILQEAKVLLKYSQWNISEIAYALGFREATHFSNFFKKHVQMSPTVFRHV